MAAVVAVVAADVVGGGLARADTATRRLAVTGEVVRTAARWTADRRSIVTDVDIRGGDGAVITVRQLGGTVDGIGMIASHYPPVLAVGDEVSAVATAASGASGASYVLRSVARAAPTSRADEPRTARYGVTRTTRTQTPIFWPTGCIHLAYDAAGVSDLDGDLEHDILDRAAAAWEAETSVCSGLAFSSAVVTDPEPGRNFVNSAIFREDRWCTPATADDDEVCHDPDIIAVTRVFFVDDPDSPRDGEIVEADMEFNAVDFAFTVDGQTRGTADKTADLLSTATHELGHLIGLAHNCETGFEAPPRDHQDALVPVCADVLPGSETAEATMFFVQEQGEVKQATLETSDVLGACATLAGAECERLVTGGCAIALASPGELSGASSSGGSGGGVPGALFAFALVALAARAARRRGGRA